MEFLTATLGAAVKSLATKAVTGPTEKLARKTLSSLDSRPVDEATRAVSKAVEAARKDLRDDFFAGEDDLSRDVVKFLEHPSLAEDVVKRLLFRGQPDFARLRQFYLETDDGEEASETWQALQSPLAYSSSSSSSTWRPIPRLALCCATAAAWRPSVAWKRARR